MRTIRKYAFVLVLALTVIYAYAPPQSLEDAARFRWLDDISVIIDRCLGPAKPEVGVSLVDPIAAANVDEDLVLGQTETLDCPARTAAALATQGPSLSVPPEQVVSTVAPAQAPRWRAAEAQNRTHLSVSWRSLQPRRHANRWTSAGLPPILLALLGEGPRNSNAFRQTSVRRSRADARHRL
jgi:hypothetical protein